MRVSGAFFKVYPEMRNETTERWMKTDNIWLQRVCLVHQLKYKDKTDADLLFDYCDRLKASPEFFIQKAIGWALRDYSRFNPSGVTEYVNSTNLKPLSQREALRNIK